MEEDAKFCLTKQISTDLTDVVLYDFVKEGKMPEFFRLIHEKSYPITPFALHCLYTFDKTDCIEELFSGEGLYSVDIYDWLVAFWGQEKADEFVCKHNLEAIITQKLSPETLAKFQKWDILLQQGRTDLIAKHEQWEFLCNNHFAHRLLEYDGGIDYLMQQKRVDILVEFLRDKDKKANKEKRLQCVRFLVENIPDETLSSKFSTTNDMTSEETEILLEHGYYKTLRAMRYLMLLYEHGKFEELTPHDWIVLYVWYTDEKPDLQKELEEHIFQRLTLEEMYERNVYKWGCGKRYLRKLVEAQNWPLLKKCRPYLLKHGFWKTWVKVTLMKD